MFDRKEYMKEYHKKWYLKNKENVIKKYKKYRKINKEKIKINNQRLHLKKSYNLTINQYTQMLKSQNGVCAICGKEEITKDSIGNVRKLSVDHNHKTNKIRGLLCVSCNHLLGNAKDNKQVLLNAINYLTKE